MTSLRPARLAGRWYPGGSELQAVLDAWLDEARAHHAPVFAPGTGLGGLIAPHAGYVFSGMVAARAYAALGAWRPARVVVIAPSHRERFSGACVWAPPGGEDGAWSTPLGEIPVDGAFRRRLLARAPHGLFAGTAGHGEEHSLELQLPFLQRVLGSFRLLPVALGLQSPATVLEVARVLAETLDDEATLLVASTDLSHFQPLDEAHRRDQRTLATFVAAEAGSLLTALEAGHAEACGGAAVALLLETLRLAAGAVPVVEILDYRSSAEACGDTRSVVGYAAATCHQPGSAVRAKETQ
jgi:MEMO1 family protein